MKKILLLSFVGVTLGLVFAFIFNSPTKTSNRVVAQSNITCDLNLDSCSVQKDGKTITFSFYPRPLSAMTPVTLKVDGLGGEYKNLNAQIYGINMDMGTIKAALEKRSNIYMGSIVLSSCVVAVMNYRLELYEGDKPLGIYIDFDLRS